MPSVKLFEKPIKYRESSCSRWNINKVLPCRRCIKCLLYNQEKIASKKAKITAAPKKERTVVMSVDIDPFPEFNLDKKKAARNKKEKKNKNKVVVTKEIKEIKEINDNVNQNNFQSSNMIDLALNYLDNPENKASYELPLFFLD